MVPTTTDDDLLSFEKLLALYRSDMVVLHQRVLWQLVGRELLALSGGTSQIIIEERSGRFTVKAAAIGESTRESLHAALSALLGNEPKFYCPGCDLNKTREAFGDNKNRKDGRAPYCWTCSRPRVAKAVRECRARKRSAT